MNNTVSTMRAKLALSNLPRFLKTEPCNECNSRVIARITGMGQELPLGKEKQPILMGCAHRLS
jgi:hypothetical protein